MNGLVNLLVWSALTYILHAYDLSHALRPKGPLGVALDYSLATSWPTGANPTATNVRRNWQFSTHLTFNEDVSQITDGQLWQIATDAFNEVEADMRQYGITVKRNRPSGMAVLAFGRELIIASSQKGTVSFTYDLAHNTPVKDSLLRCQLVWRDDGFGDSNHRTGGKCAEPMAAHLYYFSSVAPLPNQNARIATVVMDIENNLKPRAPCGDDLASHPNPIQWGCNLFVEDQNLRPVDTTIPLQPYDLATLAGGVGLRDQIQLCSVRRRT